MFRSEKVKREKTLKAQHPYSHFIQKMQLIKSKNSDGNSWVDFLQPSQCHTWSDPPDGALLPQTSTLLPWWTGRLTSQWAPLPWTRPSALGPSAWSRWTSRCPTVRWSAGRASLTATLRGFKKRLWITDIQFVYAVIHHLQCKVNHEITFFW